MITIHGNKQSGSEYEAAVALAKVAREFFPEIAESKQIVLDIFPSVQCFGQRTQDIDLLVFFADYRHEDKLHVCKNGKLIHSFCTTIEIKAHTPSSVSFSGPCCSVTYRGHVHDVTSQSEGQKYSVKNYIERNSKTESAPRIENLIWLTRVPKSLLPKQDSNLLGADTTWSDFLESISLVNTCKGLTIATFSNRVWMDGIKAIFSKSIEISKIDRKRLEAITKSIMDINQQQYAQKLGQQLLVIKGRGGTGKTVRLLQIAYQSYNELGLRVVLLTYNKALVSDIRRLLALQGVRDSIGMESVCIKTIHSFMREWLIALDICDKKSDNFIEQYEAYKQEALKMFEQGALSDGDIAEAKTKRSRELEWDILLIDESQDWPKSEMDILYKFYGYKRFVIADGVDQFVRGVERISWVEGVPASERQQINLTKSLRLKSTLCSGVIHFAKELGLQNWMLDPVPESHGGRIAVVIGDPFSEEFHRKLVATAKADGNAPVDLLFCVPPTWVAEKGDRRCSTVAEKYEQWGYQVWDAVDPTLRGEYPTSRDQFRIVQYDSCRGLEGWVVVCFALDEFYNFKKATAEISSEEKNDMFFEYEESALAYAKRWIMIPLTRAIDTLVIHVSKSDSYVADILKKLKAEYPQEIDWYDFSVLSHNLIK